VDNVLNVCLLLQDLELDQMILFLSKLCTWHLTMAQLKPQLKPQTVPQWWHHWMSREAARLLVQGGGRLVLRRSSLQRRLLLPLHRVQLTHPAQQQIPEAGKSFILIKKQVTQLLSFWNNSCWRTPIFCELMPVMLTLCWTYACDVNWWLCCELMAVLKYYVELMPVQCWYHQFGQMKCSP